MFPTTKPKVLALVTATTLERLKAYDAGCNFDLLPVFELKQAAAFIQQDKLDLVLVDIMHEEARSACAELMQISSAPVALMVREARVDWKDLCSWPVDGFVSDDAGKIEMVARVLALTRRYPKTPVSGSGERHTSAKNS
jgi:DNA-binding response OmpR family regulator